jgi:hypothetical protein
MALYTDRFQEMIRFYNQILGLKIKVTLEMPDGDSIELMEYSDKSLQLK